jgi:transposase InsO family protein
MVNKLALKKYKTDFSVRTPTGVSQGDTFVWYSLTDLLGISKLVKFFVFDFHDEFSILIGHELLTSLEANIDLGKKMIKFPSRAVPILFNDMHQLNVVNTESTGIATDYLEPVEQRQLNNLLGQFRDLFDDQRELKPSLLVKHRIRTTDEDPVFTRNYKYPQVYKDKVEIEISEMLRKGIIRPSQSPYNSPIWVVGKKPDDSGKEKIRLVIDYRKLNKKTVEDKFPLPNIDDLIYQLGQSKYYTTLDLASGFHQLEMDPESIEKTAFSTDQNHYEFLRMPFGLKNAPPTFQRAMNGLFAGRPNVLVYLDDIIIYSNTFNEHLEHLKTVFQILEKNRLTVQPDKSKFGRSELKFLGYWIDREGIRPDPDKVKAISKMTLPQSEKQIKSFLGLTGFYRKLIKNYSAIAKPLTTCLKKSSKIDPNNEQYKNAFETLRTCLMEKPILSYPNFDRPFFLTSDASNYAVGAVLAQENEKGTRLAIAYASRTLNPAEQNLSAIEKELLAVVWATRYFRHYIYGVKFVLETDHKPLLWLSNLKEPNAKLMRWKLQLNEFDFEIRHVPGKSNKVADALSRPFTLNVLNQDAPSLPIISPRAVTQVLEDCEQQSEAEPEFENFDIDAFVGERLGEEDLEDLEPPESILSENGSDHTPADPPFESEPEIREMPDTHNINVEAQQLVIKNNRSKLYREIKFETKTRINVGILDASSLKVAVEALTPQLKPNSVYGLYMKPSHLSDQTRKELISEFTRELHQKVIGLKFKIYHNLTIDVEDKDEQALIVATTHVSKTAHRGINDNYEYLKKRFYWPNMKRDVNTYINQCEVCGVTKYDRNPIKVKYKETPTPDKPFVEVQADVFFWDRTPVLTIVDRFAKRLSSFKLRAHNAKEVVRKLKSYLRQNPKPKSLQSDNGTEFKSREVRDLLEVHGIEQLFTPEAHHDALGPLNRCHSTMREVMRALKTENDSISIKELIKEATIVLNNTANSHTKLTPNEMTYGIESTSAYAESALENVKQIANLDEYMKQLRALHCKIKQVVENEKSLRTEKRNVNRENPEELKLVNPAFMKTTHHRKEKNPYSKVVAEDPYHAERRGIKRKIHPNRLKRPKKNYVVPDGEPASQLDPATQRTSEEHNCNLPGTSDNQ